MQFLIGLLLILSYVNNILALKCPDETLIKPCSCRAGDVGYILRCDNIRDASLLSSCLQKVNASAIQELHLVNVDYNIPHSVVKGGNHLPPGASVFISCNSSLKDLVVIKEAFTNQVLHQVSITDCAFESGNLDFTRYFQRIILDRVRMSELFNQKQDYQVEHLTISNSNLTEKSEKSLENLSRLRELHIDACQFGGFRTAYHIHTVGKLVFSRLDFTSRSHRFLEKFLVLKSLTFDNCTLPVKTDLVEYNIAQLLLFNLDLAQLDPEQFFLPFTNLQSLVVQNCVQLDMDKFPRLPNLESISFTQTKFSKWFDTDLTPSLTSLSITDYPYGPDALLKILDNVTKYQLTNLSLENNNFEQVPSQIAYYQDLEYLSLAGNGIVILRKGSLVLPSSLHTLDLSRNPLLFVEADAFPGDLSNLQLLLQSIRMETLSEQSFTKLLKSVKQIRFSNDVPFFCGCDIAWLFTQNRSLLSKIEDAFCYRNKQKLQDLTKANFTGCTSESLHPWSGIRNCDRSTCSNHGTCFRFPTSLVAFSWMTTSDYCRCDDGYHGRRCGNVGSYAQLESKTSDVLVLELSTGNDNYVIDVEYAHLRLCPRGTGTTCSKELPNTMALVSYWCNGKTSCLIDPVTIQTYSNIKERDSELRNDLTQNLTLEIRWRKKSLDSLTCPLGTVYRNGGDCFQVDDNLASWFTARERALSKGADLAFNGPADVPNAIGTWVLQTTDSYQRFPQPYFKAFEFGQARHKSNPSQYSATSRGLWVLPPQFNDTEADSQSLVTTLRSSAEGQWSTTVVSSFAGCTPECFPDYGTNYCWLGYPGLNVKPCPGRNSTNAKWECIKTNGKWTWASAKPDFSKCSRIDVLLADATNQLNETVVANVINSVHANLTITNTALIAGDIVILEKFLNDALDVHNRNLTAEQDAEKRYEMAKNFTQAVLNLSDLVLEQEQGWWGIPEKDRPAHLATYDETLEATVLQLAENIPNNDTGTESFVTKNLILQTETILLGTTANEPFYNIKMNDTNVAAINLESYVGSNLTLMIVYVKNAPELLSGAETIRWQNSIREGLLNASIVKTNSPSLSVVVKQDDTEGETATVKFYLPKDFVPLPFNATSQRVITYQDYIENSTCVHWDSEAEDWSSTGCREEEVSMDRYVCACNSTGRVTTLVYMENYVAHKFALKIITMVGGIISSVALVLSIFIFIWIRSSSTQDLYNPDLHITIHANLCFNLLWAQIIYLAGLESVQPDPSDGSCLTVAFLLHFFYLTTFAWMVVEAIYIYYKIYKPYENTKVTTHRCLAFGYGVPACVVSASFFSTFQSDYTNNEACFVANIYALIGGFVVPIALGITYNLVILIAVLFVALRNKLNRNATIKRNEKRAKKREILRILLSGLLLSFLLGTTWIFILLYVLQTTLEWTYAFTIVNATQGLFIVYYTCIANETVRKGLRKKLGQRKVEPARSSTSQQLTNGRTGAPYSASKTSKPIEVPTEDVT